MYSPQIYHYTTLFPSHTIFQMTEQELYCMCFQDILEDGNWGYGSKRIGVKIKGSITDKLPFSGLGFKNENGQLHVGVRMWLDQGDYIKFIPYNSKFNINQHFMELITKFQDEYPQLCSQ